MTEIEKTCETMSADGWTEWKGGKCPVPESTLVDVKFRNGCTSATNPAEEWDWQRDGGFADIVAYRVVEPIAVADHPNWADAKPEVPPPAPFVTSSQWRL